LGSLSIQARSFLCMDAFNFLFPPVLKWCTRWALSPCSRTSAPRISRVSDPLLDFCRGAYLSWFDNLSSLMSCLQTSVSAKVVRVTQCVCFAGSPREDSPSSARGPGRVGDHGLPAHGSRVFEPSWSSSIHFQSPFETQYLCIMEQCVV
jgi:hypothetical protein